MNIKAAVVVGVLTAFAGAMQAAPVDNYAFGGLGNLHSSTHTFSPVGGSGPSITASGFQVQYRGGLTAVGLYSKGSGVFPPPNDESGLGLVNDPTGDNEITQGSFIMLNLTDLSLSSLGIYTESTTSPDEWEIWGSNSAAYVGENFSIPTSGVLTGTTEGDQNVSSLEGDRYIFISAVKGNILLGGLTANSAVPEPASAGLLGLAFMGAGLLFRKRLIKKA
ncbi:MAG: PEP-CTERM sorting domain-containing protein [Bryobacteraceae bacterium]